MTLEEQINLMIKQKDLVYDKSQLNAAKHLQQISLKMLDKTFKNKLSQSGNKKNKSFSLFRKKAKLVDKQQPQADGIRVKGMYIWGEVGRGKTWLMDMFFSSLSKSVSTPEMNIHRIHFHEFMLDIHKQLQDLPTQADPLKIIATNMSKQYQLICLDEFHVMDIADAVILHGLLDGLFSNNVIIVTTSNRHPDELYKGGTHRERFLPAIELIKQFCLVFHLDSAIDYRRRNLEHEGVYLIPHKAETDERLTELFHHYSQSKSFSIDAIKIFGRDIPVVRSNDKCIWFTFNTLCRGPRSSGDYLSIAKNYHIIILSEIPVLNEGEEGPARRFLNLIDAFYDLHVHLILSSSVIIENMYQGDLLQFEFERALSRLHEMRTRAWWKDFSLIM